MVVDRYFNPFQSTDINVSAGHHEAFVRYCQGTSDSSMNIYDKPSTRINDKPFPRMVDLWFFSVCVAARLELKPADISKYDTRKIIDGSIFGSDPWRVQTLMLIAVGITGDVKIVSEPRKMMALASGLAATGLPKVIEMLKDGDADPIWNLSNAVDTLLKEEKAA